MPSQLDQLRIAVAEVQDAARKLQERVTAREAGLAQEIADRDALIAQIRAEIPEPQLVASLTQTLVEARDLLQRL